MSSPCLHSCLTPAVPGWPWPWFMPSPVPWLLIDAVTSPWLCWTQLVRALLCWSYPWPLAHPPLGAAPLSLFPDKQDKSLLNLQQGKFWITIKKISQLWPFFKVPSSPNFLEPVRCLQQPQFNRNSLVIKLKDFGSGVFFTFNFFPPEWLQGVFAWFFTITAGTSSSKLHGIAALQQTCNWSYNKISVRCQLWHN